MEAALLIAFILVGVAFVNRGKRRSRSGPQSRSRSDVPSAADWREPFDAASSRPVPTGQVVSGPAYIVDGDSLMIRKTQIRLFGVDAPELTHPYGQKAKWALYSLCKGQTVRAEVTATDDHGRTVARCYLEDGRDLSAEMVKIGLAIDWPKFSGGLYRSLEVPDARKKMWLADARQKGRMHVWESFEARRSAASKTR